MLIDMHNHTSRHSPCSLLDPEELVERISEKAISGLVITEHDYVWPPSEIEDLKRKSKTFMPIFSGQEVSTDIGHLIVLGYRDGLRGLSSAAIIDTVRRSGGVIILAHPFRNGEKINESAASLARLFSMFDAVEILNGNQNHFENAFSRNVQDRLGIKGTGGSDAHSARMIGKYVTWFEGKIENEADLIEQIRTGRYHPVAYEKADLYAPISNYSTV